MDAVLFDMDGVLIDSETAHQKAEISTLAMYGIGVTVDDLKAYAGASREALQEGISRKYNVDLDWKEFFQRKDEMLKRLFDHIQPMEGVTALLMDLKAAEIKLGLATSSQRFFKDKVLEKFQWQDLFEATVCANDINRSKPDPEIFLTCAERLQVDPHHCTVIEDSVNGVKGAKAAGMFTIAITSTFSREELSEADLIIDRFGELNAARIQEFG